MRNLLLVRGLLARVRPSVRVRRFSVRTGPLGLKVVMVVCVRLMVLPMLPSLKRPTVTKRVKRD